MEVLAEIVMGLAFIMLCMVEIIMIFGLILGIFIGTIKLIKYFQK